MKTATITIRISQIEKDMLITEAEKKDIPVSQIIRDAIRKHINQKEVEKINESIRGTEGITRE